MQINTKNLVSITEANQNFSKVARILSGTIPCQVLENINNSFQNYSCFNLVPDNDGIPQYSTITTFSSH